jgi:hypothetical protein
MADRVVTTSDDFAVRHQEVAPGEFAPEVYTVTAVTAAVAQQRFFIASTQPLVLTAAGNARATIANPAGSGRKLMVARLTVFSDAAGEAGLFINPTAGLPGGTARPMLNAVVGGAAGVAELRADTSTLTALSGGADTGVTAAFTANRREQIDLPPLVLTPGVTLGVNVPINATSSRSLLSAYWFEEDL